MKISHLAAIAAALTMSAACDNGVTTTRTAFNNGWNYPVPDDRMLAGPRSADSPAGSAQAFFQGGDYTYHKTFDAPEEWASKHVEFLFEGIYRDPVISINGTEAARSSYGYLPVRVNADGLLKYGQANEITVSCTNSDQPDSRWYTGAGIYRPVWLIVQEQTHLRDGGVRIKTESIDPVRLTVSAEVRGPEAGALDATVEILGGPKAKISEWAKEEDGKALGSVALDFPKAKLWSDESPNLYTCRVTLPNGDVQEATFGIRTVEADAQDGLRVNGKKVLLRGGCLHHSQGLLGAATYDKSEDRRVRLLKDAGYNAIRSAHNPASRALLEACDKYGVYVMDEAWDMWYNHKNKYDYASSWEENHIADLTAMVDLDYNHPSVIMYSIGNEVSEPAEPKGVEATRRMVETLHGQDPTRLVTGGFNLMILMMSSAGRSLYDSANGGLNQDGGGSFLTNGQGGAAGGDKPQGQLPGAGQGQPQGQPQGGAFGSAEFNQVAMSMGDRMNNAANSDFADRVTSPSLDLLDVAGYNYANGRYPLEGEKHPQRVIVGSETLPQDISKNWRMVEALPYLIGDFMWTAWDYLGEVGIGAWSYDMEDEGFSKGYPWLTAGESAFDILGHAGPAVAQARAAWKLTDEPWIGVSPVSHSGQPHTTSIWRGSDAMDSWSWKGCEGRQAQVEVYSTGSTVELFLNGENMGTATVDSYDKASFSIAYAPGTLRAVAYDEAGAAIGESELRSSEGELRIGVHPEEEGIAADDICYVPINIEDAGGTVESNADAKLRVSVEGGELLACGTASPKTAERYDSGSFTSYYGRGMAIVKATGKGPLTIRVSADGMPEATATIKVR